MNEALQNSLAAIIERATTGIDAGVSFLSGQLPEVVNQLILYTAVINGLWLLLTAVLLPIPFLSWAAYKKHWHAEKAADSAYWKTYGNVADTYAERHVEHARRGNVFFCLLCVSGLANVVTLCGAVTSVATLLQLWLAPKVWLIQYAAELAK